MNGYAKIAEQVIINQILSNAFPVTRNSKARLGLIALSGFLIIVALGFTTYGSYLWLNTNFPTHIASIVMGILAFTLAILSLVGASIFSHFQKVKAKKAKADITYKFIETANIIGNELGYPIADNPKLSLAISSLAGIVAGRKIP